MKKKLNFGCGNDLLKGYINVDKVQHNDKHEVYDILMDWPYPAEEFDEILTEHTMHMFNYKHYPLVCNILWGNLKPGGLLHIIDFDPIKAFEAYQRGDSEALIIPDEVEPTLDGKFNAYLTWYSTRQSLFTAKGLAEKLESIGFEKVTYGTEFKKGEKRPNESFWVKAHRPLETEEE